MLNEDIPEGVTGGTVWSAGHTGVAHPTVVSPPAALAGYRASYRLAVRQDTLRLW